MKLKELLTVISVCVCVQIGCSDILELGEDEQGIPVWKSGEYRDRNEIPLPSNYDDEKKHKRDTAEISSIKTNVNKQKEKDNKKNLIDRVHFAMPFGVDLPLYHISKGSGKKGKKSAVPGTRQSRSDRLKLDNMLEYAKLDAQPPDRKSSVSRTWGMTYEDVFQDEPKETTGQSRSNLAAAYKLKEEDLEGGMMFRGLGGLKLRDQNHQIIEGKFAEEEADEPMNVRSDVSKSM